jgi:hypothetical protein
MLMPQRKTTTGAAWMLEDLIAAMKRMRAGRRRRRSVVKAAGTSAFGDERGIWRERDGGACDRTR